MPGTSPYASMILSDRINTYGQDLLKRYGIRVHKVALDAGFTCPNRDGTKGTGGCKCCSNFSFSRVLDLMLKDIIRHGDLQAQYGKRITIHVTNAGLHLHSPTARRASPRLLRRLRRPTSRSVPPHMISTCWPRARKTPTHYSSTAVW